MPTSLLSKLGVQTSVPVKRASALWLEQAQAERRASLYQEEEQLSPVSPLRKQPVVFHDEVSDEEYQHELMLRHIYKRARSSGWLGDGETASQVQIVLRTVPATDEADAIFLSAPHVEYVAGEDDYVSLLDLAGFLQCEVIIAITSKVTSMLLRHLPPNVRRIPLDGGINVQVIDAYEDFMSIRRAQFAAFVRENNTLLIWSDQVNSILPFGREMEEKVVNLIWDEKHNLENGFIDLDDSSDIEIGTAESTRTVSFMTPSVVAIALMAIASFIGQDLHEVILQIKADSNYLALGILLYFPILLWLGAFFAQIFATVVLNMLGPVSHLTTNSKYYSSIPPIHNPEITLPHITVQCPVYMEDLDSVLEPALQTVKDAIKTYEMQGGTANIYMNDDGIQVLAPEERKRRIDFYKRNNIGWIARPPDGLNGFIRAGRFKKASNMNYAMNISHKLETELAKSERPHSWSDLDEVLVTESTLKDLLAAQSPPAQGDGDVRIGDLILLIDADTRIPSDCFLDAANEFHNSPDLAILQHSSLAFQVVHNYWEDCMAYFTLYVSEAMKFMTAGGDVCPFVGHNAFLRWSAIQEVGIENSEGRSDSYRLWWSESHVSEDFELSLKLQDLGYTVRLASYSGGEFKEGVSLTVYDEYSRWQKYAYGVSELVFHPFSQWFTKSPFTPLFRRFLTSAHVSGTSKFTMVAYMGSYYAIASAWILSLINFFLVGWAEVLVTNLYQTSFQILIATLVVFDVAVPIANGIYRYRTRQAGLLSGTFQNFKWILVLALFFGGLSLHVTQSLVWHLCGIPLHWDATAKSLEQSFFLKELPMIWRRYRALYLGIAATSVGLIILGSPVVPSSWRIPPSVFTGFPIGWILACHAIGPLLLNPQSWLSEIHL